MSCEPVHDTAGGHASALPGRIPKQIAKAHLEVH